MMTIQFDFLKHFFYLSARAKGKHTTIVLCISVCLKCSENKPEFPPNNRKKFVWNVHYFYIPYSPIHPQCAKLLKCIEALGKWPNYLFENTWTVSCIIVLLLFTCTASMQHLWVDPECNVSWLRAHNAAVLLYQKSLVCFHACALLMKNHVYVFIGL